MISTRVAVGRVGPAVAPIADTWRARAAVAVLVASLFFERLDKHLYLGGRFPIPDVTFVAVGVCFVAFVLTQTTPRALARRTFVPPEAALVGLVALLGGLSLLALFLGPVGTAGATQSLKTYAHIAFLLVVAVVVGRALRPSLVVFAFRTYLVIAACTCALALLQALDLNALHTGLSATLGLGTRAYGSYIAPLSIYSEPAYLGYAAMEGLLIAVLLEDVRRSLLAAAAAIVCLAGLLASVSAGALAIAAVVAVYLGVAHLSRGVDRRAVGGAVAVVAAAALLAAVTPVGHVAVHRAKSIWSGSDHSAQYRRAVDEAAVKVWRRSRVVGVGLGNSRVYLPQYVHFSFLPNFRAEFVDASAYAGLLAESGPLGVVGLLVALGFLFHRSRSRDGVEQLTRTLVLLTALECLVIGAFIRPAFWMVGGLRLAAVRSDGTPDPPPAESRSPSAQPSAPAPRRRRVRRYVLGVAAVAAVLVAAVAAVVLIRHHNGSRSGRASGSARRTSGFTPYDRAVLRDRPLDYWRLSGPDGAPVTGSRSGGTVFGKHSFARPSPVGHSGTRFLELKRGGFAVLPGPKFTGRKPFSLELWVKPHLLSGYPRLISTEGDAGSHSAYALLYDTHVHALLFERYRGHHLDAAGKRLVFPRSWTYVVATYDGTALRLYVNGRLVATGTSTLRLVGGGMFAVGTGASWYWRGGVAAAAVYPRALAASRVRAHYDAAR